MTAPIYLYDDPGDRRPLPALRALPPARRAALRRVPAARALVGAAGPARGGAPRRGAPRGLRRAGRAAGRRAARRAERSRASCSARPSCPAVGAALPADVTDPLRFVDGTGRARSASASRAASTGRAARPPARVAGRDARRASASPACGTSSATCPAVLPDDLERLRSPSTSGRHPPRRHGARRPGAGADRRARWSSRTWCSTCARARSCWPPGVEVRALHAPRRARSPWRATRASSAARSRAAPSARAASCTARSRPRVFLGYANKAHDGFLGHSVVGPLGEPRRRHDQLEPQEHLRPGPGARSTASGSRPASCSWAR